MSSHFFVLPLASRDTSHFEQPTTVELLIHYTSTTRDRPARNSPRLWFLSHNNYINSTNWGVAAGPVFHF